MRSWRLALLLLSSSILARAQDAALRATVTDEVVRTVPESFFGLHYDGPEHQSWDELMGKLVTLPGAYGNPAATDALRQVGAEFVRVFVWVNRVVAADGTQDWADVDAQVAQAEAAGFDIMLCLHQAPGKWLSEEGPAWWETERGRELWRAFADGCARRYASRIRYFEILNEPNHVDKDSENFMGWENSAALYLDAARAVRTHAPGARCGGAATWAAWESYVWAKTVLAQPGGESLLDFVSYHIYTSHDLEDSEQKILEKTAWFREAPEYIRRELAALTPKPIAVVLTEFNTSAVWQKDGELFTDPRDINAFGGMVAVLALLNSAAGGADMAVHFGTTGGFGLVRWPPIYERQPKWYALELLVNRAGLRPGAELLAVKMPEPETTVKSCVGGEIPWHPVEVFGVRRAGSVAVIAINKQHSPTVVALEVAGATGEAELYRYSSTRIAEASYPEAVGLSDGGRHLLELESYAVAALVWQ